MPRLILHAGLHKTGNSAIQLFAHRNRTALRRRGVWYPDIPRGTAESAKEHLLFAHAVANGKHRMTLQDARVLAGQWAKSAAATGETVFLSAEAICRHLADPSTGEWLVRRRSYLERLAGVLSGFDVSVVLVLRRQDEFVRSVYQEMVMQGAPRGRLSFPEFRNTSSQGTRFLDNLAVFEEVYGKITVLVFEDLPKNDGMCASFFEALGVDASGLAPVGVVRKSMSAPQTVVKQFLNRYIRSKKQNRPVLKWVRGKQMQTLLGKYYNSEDLDLWESQEARTEFLARFDAENEALLRRYFPSREKLFPPLTPVRPKPTATLPGALREELLHLLEPGSRAPLALSIGRNRSRRVKEI